MLTVTVAQDGSGDFASIAEAVLAVPYEEEALVQVGPGIYREKLVCEKRCITLRGAGADKTKLVWGDGGKLPHKDGRPTHTFRSYTAFFSGETLCRPGRESRAGRRGLCGQHPGGVPPGQAAGQSGHALLRPAARKGAGEGWLSRPARSCAPQTDRPVLHRL